MNKITNNIIFILIILSSNIINLSVPLFSYDLGTIVITAPKLELSNSDHFAIKSEKYSTIDIITKEQIKERTVSLSEIFENISGVQIKKYGGLDEYATISMRGSSAEQVSIFIDGMPLNNPLGGGYNLANIPLDNIERLEIYKGSAPFALGGQAVGGIVNIRTLNASRNAVDCAISYGSFNYKKTLMNFTRATNKFSTLLHFQYTDADNDYSYKHDNKTHLISSDDYIDKRRNNHTRKYTVFGKFDYTFKNDYSTRFTFTHQNENKGLAGVFYNNAKIAKLETSDYSVNASVIKRNIFNTNGTAEFSIYNEFNTDKFFDPLAELGWNKRDTNDKTRQYGSSLLMSAFIGNYSKTTINLRFNKIEFSPSDAFNNNQFFKQSRAEKKIALENLFLLFSEKLSLTPGLLIENFDNKKLEQKSGVVVKQQSFLKDTFISKQIGINYKINKNAAFKSSFGLFYRVPNMYELFGDRGYSVGNASLKPEKSLNVDAGVIMRGNIDKINITAEIIVFNRSVKDLIQWLSYSTQIMYPENIGKADITGIESNLQLRYSKFYYSGAYTYLDTKNKEASVAGLNRELPYKPKYDTSNEIGYDNKTIGLKIYTQYNYTGESYKDLNNSFKNESHQYWNAGATYLYNKCGFNFEIKNINNELSQDVYGFPLPGRSYYGKLNFNF